jgi:hypothetical protein
MATIYAQHADAGQYHLETCYCKMTRRWEWFVLKNGKKIAEFSGDTDMLEAAQRNAAMRVGLYPEGIKWMPIGPPIEVPG